MRDAEGRFRGVLEMMQDCTRIRSLEGSRTLLTWDKSNKEASKGQAETTSAAAPEVAQEPEEGSPEPTPSASEPLELGPETRLKALLEAYPWLKQALPEINPAFKMLSSPLARIMIPKATLAMMSERSGMPLEELRAAILQRITQHQG